MREIKFRAWDRLLERWLTKDDVFINLLGDLNSQLGEEELAIDLSQFTGLKSKSGVEIYEGDIVRFLYEGSKNAVENHVVEWCYDRWDAGNGYPDGSAVAFEEMEVIGNIYENPELLK